MDWIEFESFRLFCPAFADVFVRSEAFESFEAACVIVSIDEVVQVRTKLSMAVIVITLDGGFLDDPVHSLDLPVGPWMFNFGRPVIDAMCTMSAAKSLP